MLVTNKEKVISIGLIDNNVIMRIGLSIIFHEHFQQVRVSEAATADEFQQRGSDTDLILFGINNGTAEQCLDKAAWFRAAFPRQKLIVYDERKDANLIVGYLKLGINGYIRQNSGEKEMIQCVENVLLGQLHLCPELITMLLTALARAKPKSGSISDLSGRESEVARYLCQGMKTSTIAETLRRKPSTISTIKHNILKKMDVKNVIELMTVMQKPYTSLYRNGWN